MLYTRDKTAEVATFQRALTSSMDDIVCTSVGIEATQPSRSSVFRL